MLDYLKDFFSSNGNIVPIIFMLLILFCFLVWLNCECNEEKRYKKEQEFKQFIEYIFFKYGINTKKGVKALYVEYYLSKKKHEERENKQFIEKFEAECSFEDLFR